MLNELRRGHEQARLELADCRAKIEDAKYILALLPKQHATAQKLIDKFMEIPDEQPWCCVCNTRHNLNIPCSPAQREGEPNVP